MEDLSQKIIICQAGIHWIFCPSKTPRGMGFHPANKMSPEAPPNPIKFGISLALSHQGRKTRGAHRCASVLIRTGGRGGLWGCSFVPAPRFIPRRPTWAGGAPRGVMFVVFPGSPSRKNILGAQRFPFCRHTNEPQTQPASKPPPNEPLPTPVRRGP